MQERFGASIFIELVHPLPEPVALGRVHQQLNLAAAWADAFDQQATLAHRHHRIVFTVEHQQWGGDAFGEPHRPAPPGAAGSPTSVSVE